MDMSKGEVVETSQEEIEEGGDLPKEKTLAESTDRAIVVSSHLGTLKFIEDMVMVCRYRDYLPFDKLHLREDHVEAFNTKDVEICAENIVDIKTLVENPGKVFVGKFLFCRTILPAILLEALVTVVEDASMGIVVTLELHNFVTCEWKPVVCDQILPGGSFLAIKNPRLSKETVTLYSKLHAIKVINSPAEVELLSFKTAVRLSPGIEWSSYVLLSDTKFDSCFWSKFDYFKDEDIAVALSKLGNVAHKASRYPEAIRWFNLALEYGRTKDSAASLLANKAAAFLRMRCFHRALQDCNAILERDGKHLMGIFRKTKALLGLGKYEEAAAFVHEMLKTLNAVSSDKLKKLIEIGETAKTLASEISKDTVDVDMGRLLALKEYEDTVEDIIEFNGAVELFFNDGRKADRGLRATADIQPGQLLLCSKAFAYEKSKKSHHGDRELISSGEVDNALSLFGEAEDLYVKAAYKIAYQPEESGPEFYKLFAGPELAYLRENSETSQFVDMKRIRSIVQYNCFGTGAGNRISGQVTDTYTAVWTLPSMINHSCSDANASWSNHGDILVVRAIKKIAKGEEIFISYVLPTSSYGYRKQSFKVHSFECACRLCECDKVDEENGIGEKRDELLKELKTLVNGNNWKKISDIVKNLGDLRKSLPNLNACLATDLVHEASRVMYNFQPQKSLELLEKIHNVEQEVGLWRCAVVTALNAIRCCLYLKDTRRTRNWAKSLEKDAIVAYGSVDALKVWEAKSDFQVIADLKSVGIDTFGSKQTRKIPGKAP